LHPDNKKALEQRVVRAAEAALAHHEYVSSIDVFTGMGLLTPANVAAWRKGRVDFLERVIQGNLKKISLSMATFRRWARGKDLRPSETGYVRRTRGAAVDLRFSKSGNPGIEKAYRTHYVSPTLSQRKRQKQLEERLRQAPQPVVECDADLPQGSS
jgi:hypothetical protein